MKGDFSCEREIFRGNIGRPSGKCRCFASGLRRESCTVDSHLNQPRLKEVRNAIPVSKVGAARGGSAGSLPSAGNRGDGSRRKRPVASTGGLGGRSADVQNLLRFVPRTAGQRGRSGRAVIEGAATGPDTARQTEQRCVSGG